MLLVLKVVHCMLCGVLGVMCCALLSPFDSRGWFRVGDCAEQFASGCSMVGRCWVCSSHVVGVVGVRVVQLAALAVTHHTPSMARVATACSPICV